jgi:hypothetical protein
MWIRESSKPQLCRGVDLPRNMEADAVKLSHVEKDFIAFYSTTPRMYFLNHIALQVKRHLYIAMV